MMYELYRTLKISQTVRSIDPHGHFDVHDSHLDIWRSLCFRTYALAAQSLCMKRDPDSWRKAFFVCQLRFSVSPVAHCCAGHP